ncbi:MAG: cupin domain-containing protein [Solirubrobacterales bacterium]
MAQAGQVIRGANGFALRLIRTGAETGGELLEMEATWGGDGRLPPEHLHPSQNERFEVLEGAVRTLSDGTDGRYEVGEIFEVPAGTVHQMTGDGPARVRWEVRPALRTAEFFERLYDGATQDDFAAFLEEFRDEIRFSAARD